MRWLVVLVLVVAAGRADAQVFKPRAQTKTTAKTAKAEKTPAAAPRKSARTTGTGRKSAAPTKSRVARGKGRPSDLTPEPKNADEDVVIITDEDEDE